MLAVEIEIPGWNLPTQINQSANRFARHAAVKAQRKRLALYWLAHVGRGPLQGPPYVVTLTRVGPRRIDSDNAVSAFKHVRDEIAARIGINDGDTRIAWLYRQERGPFSVRVRVESGGAP